MERDTPVMDLETDKIVLEVPAPEEGVISEIKTEVGAVVKANEVLAVLDNNSQKTKAAMKKPEAIRNNEKSASPVASPAAEKIAQENSIDLSILTGTGKGQRITKQDVLNLIGQQSIAASDATKAIDKAVLPETVLKARPSGNSSWGRWSSARLRSS